MLSKRSKARIIRILVILAVVLALAVAGVVIAVNQLLAGQMTQNAMPADGIIYLYEQEDGTTRMEWSAGINADNYTVEVTKGGSSEVLFTETTTKRSCILPKLSSQDRLTIRVRSGAVHKGKTYPGSNDLLVSLKLEPPTINDLQWEVDPDTDILKLQAVMNSDTACRMQLTNLEGETGDQQELLGGKSTLTFGNGEKYPIPTAQSNYTLTFTAYRQSSQLVYYGIQAKTVTLTREQFLGSFLKLEYETSGSSAVTLTWNETKGDYYQLQKLSDDGQSWETLYTVDHNGDLRYTIDHLDTFRKYRFRVVAVTGEGETAETSYSAELNVSTGVSAQFATVWPLIDLDVYADAEMTNTLGTAPAGKAYCVLAEVGGLFQVRFADGVGYVESNYCMINLPEYMGDLCSYNITNSYSSIFKVHDYPIAAVTETVIQGYENVEQENGHYLVPLLYPTAKKLVAAAENARANGYRLKIYEAYRPREATLSVYKLTESIVQQTVPMLNMTYFQLMTDNGRYALGNFLANGISNHNRGVALDLTLETMDREEVDMQTSIHDLSWYSEVSANNSAANLLRKIMTNAGLAPLKSEWWHFQDDEAKYSLDRIKELYDGVSAQCWMRDDYGWRYRLADGSWLRSCVRAVDGVTYTFDSNGYATAQ